MSPDAGYSGTPLRKKLGIRDRSLVRVVGPAPNDLDIGEIFANDLPGDPPYDVVLAFVTTEQQLRAHIHDWSDLIAANGGLWICWPKKAARKIVPSDMAEDAVRDVALPMGLVDNKVCAIDDIWSGLRLVWRLEHRAIVAARLNR
jgi:hypothetical protein